MSNFIVEEPLYNQLLENAKERARKDKSFDASFLSEDGQFVCTFGFLRELFRRFAANQAFQHLLFNRIMKNEKLWLEIFDVAYIYVFSVILDMIEEAVSCDNYSESSLGSELYDKLLANGFLLQKLKQIKHTPSKSHFITPIKKLQKRIDGLMLSFSPELKLQKSQSLMFQEIMEQDEKSRQ